MKQEPAVTLAWQIEAIQEALQSIEDGTAKFVSHEKVSAWLDSWGTDNELDPPECK